MNETYSHNDSDIHGYKGILFANSEIEDIFKKEIKDKLLDTEGTIELTSNFEDLTKTGFNKDELAKIFDLSEYIKSFSEWRIGEALTEIFLEREYNVRFHYNELRDARNPLSNKTGADVIGFIDKDGITKFAFGEVKTSNDSNSPPQVMYGRTGMTEQLESLAVNISKRNALIRYIGMKVKDLDDSNPFRIDFANALDSYHKSRYVNFSLFGVLVRDTNSNESDCRPRYFHLFGVVEDSIGLKLLALYVPIKMDTWESIVSEGKA